MAVNCTCNARSRSFFSSAVSSFLICEIDKTDSCTSYLSKRRTAWFSAAASRCTGFLRSPAPSMRCTSFAIHCSMVTSCKRRLDWLVDELS